MASFSMATGGLSQQQIDAFQPAWRPWAIPLGFVICLAIMMTLLLSVRSQAEVGSRIGQDHVASSVVESPVNPGYSRLDRVGPSDPSGPGIMRDEP